METSDKVVADTGETTDEATPGADTVPIEPTVEELLALRGVRAVDHLRVHAGADRFEHVAAGEDDGNGLRLHGRGLGVTLLGDGTGQLGQQAEFGKRLVQGLLQGSTCRGKMPTKPVQDDTKLLLDDRRGGNATARGCGAQTG